MIRIESIAAPTTPVLTVQDVKSHLRCEDDVYLDSILIPGVTAKIEERFGVALREQQFRQTQDKPLPGVKLPDTWHPPRQVASYSGQRIKLMRRPVASVEEIVTLDEDGAETAFTDYYLSGEYIVLKPSLPSYRSVGGIQVEFTAGGAVSDSVRLDLLRVMTDVYDHRGTYVTGTVVSKLPDLSGMFADLREVAM